MLRDRLNQVLDSTYIVECMLKSGKNWSLMRMFVNDIMSRKEEMEHLQEQEVSCNRSRRDVARYPRK